LRRSLFRPTRTSNGSFHNKCSRWRRRQEPINNAFKQFNFINSEFLARYSMFAACFAVSVAHVWLDQALLLSWYIQWTSVRRFAIQFNSIIRRFIKSCRVCLGPWRKNYWTRTDRKQVLVYKPSCIILYIQRLPSDVVPQVGLDVLHGCGGLRFNAAQLVAANFRLKYSWVQFPVHTCCNLKQ
jgi:hypothetical protein